MEPPKGGACAEHQLPGADLQDSRGGPLTKKQPQDARRTSPARQSRRSGVGKWREGRILLKERRPAAAAASNRHSSCPILRAVLLGHFRLFHNYLADGGPHTFWGNRGILRLASSCHGAVCPAEFSHQVQADQVLAWTQCGWDTSDSQQQSPCTADSLLANRVAKGKL